MSNTFNPQIDKYANLIDSYIYTKNKVINVGGGVFFGNKFRILKFMDHEIDFNPEGYIILSRNKDIPGVVGKVGTILGESRINIAEYILSRSNSSEAFGVIKVDERLNSDLLKELINLDEILNIIQIEV